MNRFPRINSDFEKEFESTHRKVKFFILCLFILKILLLSTIVFSIFYWGPDVLEWIGNEYRDWKEIVREK